MVTSKTPATELSSWRCWRLKNYSCRSLAAAFELYWLQFCGELEVHHVSVAASHIHHHTGHSRHNRDPRCCVNGGSMYFPSSYAELSYYCEHCLQLIVVVQASQSLPPGSVETFVLQLCWTVENSTALPTRLQCNLVRTSTSIYNYTSLQVFSANTLFIHAVLLHTLSSIICLIPRWFLHTYYLLQHIGYFNKTHG